MTAKLENVRDVARNVRGDEVSYNSCYELNKKLQKQLREALNVEAEFIEGEVLSKFENGERSQQGHFFLFVPSDEIEDMDTGFILDITADQFTNKNLSDDSNEVNVSLEQVIKDIPKVMIITPSDKLYNHYGL